MSLDCQMCGEYDDKSCDEFDRSSVTTQKQNNNGEQRQAADV